MLPLSDLSWTNDEVRILLVAGKSGIRVDVDALHAKLREMA